MPSMSMHFIIAACLKQARLDRDEAQPTLGRVSAELRRDQEAFLVAAVKGGRFTTADHVIRAGLDLLNHIEAERLFPSANLGEVHDVKGDRAKLSITVGDLEALLTKARSPQG
jgi:Arc/MetJ-type ribon-helix-helix transcriptional regulator